MVVDNDNPIVIWDHPGPLASSWAGRGFLAAIGPDGIFSHGRDFDGLGWREEAPIQKYSLWEVAHRLQLAGSWTPSGIGDTSG